MRSEQEDGLELDSEAPVEDPPSWRRDDPDQADPADTAPAEQLTAPGGAGDLTDRPLGDDESTEIAEHAGSAYPGGPEHQAVRIDEEP